MLFAPALIALSTVLADAGVYRTSAGPVSFRVDPSRGGPGPRPTVFCLAMDAETSLGVEYGDVIQPMVAAGWLALSIDLPGHGQDQRPGEPGQLATWALRIRHEEDIAAVFTAKIKVILDELIGLGLVDGKRIVATGISRGGWMALQLQAREPRIGKVAVLQPVTDLLALQEFDWVLLDAPWLRGFISRLSAATNAPSYHAPLWVLISSTDDRVSTAKCREFVQQARLGVPVDFTETNESAGHTYPGWAPTTAAAWLMK